MNIVVWNDSLAFKGRHCLDLEKLDVNLNLQQRQPTSLELKGAAPMMQQVGFSCTNVVKQIALYKTKD